MPNRPNLVWLTIDSIRKDHCSVYGHHRQTTPNLESIADDGVAYSKCFSHGIWSLPSAGSIISGTLPSHHRLGEENDKLPDGVQTVSEALSSAEYHTVGVSINPWFTEERGLNRGFDDFTYLEKSNVLAAGISRVAKFLLSLNRHSGGYTKDTAKFRSEYLGLGLVQSRLNKLARQDNPFFLYAHTEGAHTPYYPPKRSLDIFAEDLEMDPLEARERVYDIHQNLYREIANGLGYEPETWKALEVMYDTLIHYIDSQIGAIFDIVTDIDNTIFVVTSDHGDLIGEHDLLSHKVSLHNGLLNVPMIVHGADFAAESDDLLQHIDVLQTLLESAEVDTDFMQGIDLNSETREVAISQRGDSYFWKTMDQVLEYNPNFDVSKYHSGFTSAIQNHKYKLITSDEKTELLKLIDEKTDKSDDFPGVVEELSSILESRLAEIGQAKRVDGEVEISDNLRQRLDDLGYV